MIYIRGWYHISLHSNGIANLLLQKLIDQIEGHNGSLDKLILKSPIKDYDDDDDRTVKK